VGVRLGRSFRVSTPPTSLFLSSSQPFFFHSPFSTSPFLWARKRQEKNVTKTEPKASSNDDNSTNFRDIFLEVTKELGQEKNAKKIFGILESNWYDNTESFKEMDKETCVSLKIPLRLRDAVLAKIKDLDQVQALQQSNPQQDVGPIGHHIPKEFKTYELKKNQKDQRKSGIIEEGNRKYSLSVSQMGPVLKADFDDMFSFLTQKFVGEPEPRLVPYTAERRMDAVRCLLGWIITERPEHIKASTEQNGQFQKCKKNELEEMARKAGLPTAGLSKKALVASLQNHYKTAEKGAVDFRLTQVFPKLDASNSQLIFDFVLFLETKRKLYPSTISIYLQGLQSLAKYILH